MGVNYYCLKQPIYFAFIVIRIYEKRKIGRSNFAVFHLLVITVSKSFFFGNCEVIGHPITKGTLVIMVYKKYGPVQAITKCAKTV